MMFVNLVTYHINSAGSNSLEGGKVSMSHKFLSQCRSVGLYFAGVVLFIGHYLYYIMMNHMTEESSPVLSYKTFPLALKVIQRPKKVCGIFTVLAQCMNDKA